MICFSDRKLFFKRLIVEFATPKDIELFKRNNCDLILSFNMFDRDNIDSGVVPTWILLYKDICDEDELLKKQHKHIRNSVSFCIREGVKYTFLKSKDITKDVLLTFTKMCNQMYKLRGLKTKVNIRFLNEYIKNDNLYLSYASFNGEVCCYHVYAGDAKHCRLWYSCSLIHDNNRNDELYSKINRYCQHFDMLTFYKNGYDSYDFGGINSVTDPDGRAKFKMQFCGQYYELYQKQYNLSKKANLYNSLLTFFHKIRRR